MTTILGTETVYTTDQYLGGALNACKFQFLGPTGEYSGSMFVYFGIVDAVTNKGVFGIYDVTTGRKVASTAEKTGLATGLNSIALIGNFPLVNGDWYWLVLQTPVGQNTAYRRSASWEGIAGQFGYVDRDVKLYDGTLPDTIPPFLGTTASIISIYAALEGGAPPVQNGFILINAYQDDTAIIAAVTLDGVAGTTPVTFTLPVGTYNLTATYQGQTLPAQSVTITEGQTVTVNLLFPLPVYLTIVATEGGTTDPIPNKYQADKGSSVQVSAIPQPDSGYMFDHFELDGVTVSITSPYTVIMDTDHTILAVFVVIPPSPPNKNYLTISATVGGMTTPETGTWEFDIGSTVSVRANPDNNYSFDHWELDGVVSKDMPISVLINADRNLHAVFTTKPAVIPLWQIGTAFISTFGVIGLAISKS